MGIAKETRPSPGSSPTAVAASDYIPFSTITPFDNVKYLEDKGFRGSMVDLYGEIQGPIYSEFDLTGDVYPDSTGYFYAGVLGDVTVTGSSAPYTHAMSTLNSQATNGQPVTWTLSDYYGEGTASTRQFAGTQFASIDTKFTADALLTHTTKGMGFQSVSASNPTPSFSTVTPVPVWEGVTTLNSSVTAVIADGNINISRPVSPIFTLTGNQNPYQLFAGPVDASGALLLVLESDAQLNYYLQNTQPTLNIAFTAGTGATATGVTFNMTKCAFTVAKIERTKDYVELNVTFKAVANTTDAGTSAGYSPIKVTLKNAKPSGTYA